MTPKDMEHGVSPWDEWSEDEWSGDPATWSVTIATNHERASRAMALALTAKDASSWGKAAFIWQGTLLPYERACLAFAALSVCEPEHAEQIVMRGPDEAGPPLTPFADLMGEALLWAEVASVAERKAYCLAAYLSLDEKDRHAFLAKISERCAA